MPPTMKAPAGVPHAVRHRPQFVDLFCGAGGASAGAVASGYEVIYAVDACPLSLAAHARNHPECQHVLASMPADLPKMSLRKEGASLHVHVSPPCQALSPANVGRKGNVDVHRSREDAALALVRWAVTYARTTGDTWSFEQVVRHEIRSFLEQEGVEYTVVDAADYGVAQHRKRIVAGSGPFVERLRAHAALRRPRVGVQDVLEPRGTHMRNRNYRMLVADGDGGHKLVPCSWTRMYRPVSMPSWTVTAGSPPRWYVESTGEMLQPTESELATLQGMPSHYVWEGTQRDVRRQIGNALPPPIMTCGLTGDPGR